MADDTTPHLRRRGGPAALCRGQRCEPARAAEDPRGPRLAPRRHGQPDRHHGAARARDARRAGPARPGAHGRAGHARRRLPAGVRGPAGELPAPTSDGKIVLPGLRRAIVPKTQGQRDYLQAISNHDIVVGIGPPAPARPISPSPRRSRRWRGSGSSASSWPAPRSRPASRSASSPATCRPRSTPTCGRCTMRWRT